MKRLIRATYIGALVLLLSFIVMGCGPKVQTDAEAAADALALKRAYAQRLLDDAEYACRAGQEYLIYNAGPYTSITATGNPCITTISLR